MNVKVYFPKINGLLQLGLLLTVLKISLGFSEVVFYNTTIDNILTVVCSIIFVAVILQENYSIKALTIYAVIAVVSLYTGIITRQYGFLITVLTCLAIREESFDNVIKHIFLYELFFLIVHCVIASVSIALTGDHLGMIVGGRFRYKFGFGHPNTFAIYFFSIILMWCWLNYKKIRIKNILAIYVLALVVFNFTLSRTLLIAATILCGLLLVAYNSKRGHVIELGGKYSTLLMAIIMLFLCFTYKSGNPVNIAIDTLLSGRIKLGAYAYNQAGITWFGQPVIQSVHWDSYWGLNSHTYDCVYTVLAMQYGLAWLFVISLSFYKIAKSGDIKTSIFIIVWALYSVTEVHPLNCYLSFPILLISQLLPTVKKNQRINVRFC